MAVQTPGHFRHSRLLGNLVTVTNAGGGGVGPSLGVGGSSDVEEGGDKKSAAERPEESL